VSAPATLDWWEDGEAFCAAALDRLTEPDLDRPSLLPGWPRRTVIAHLARNADALVNLLTWAHRRRNPDVRLP
jgi:maleylpyruvate isomerase